MLKSSETEISTSLQKKILWLDLFVILLFFVLILRLWYLQITKGQEYRKRSEHNRIRLREIPAYRGKIMDRNGIVLVDNKPSYNLYLIPEEIDKPEDLLKKLSCIVKLDVEKAKKSIISARKTCSFKPICIKRDISFDEVAKIETNKLSLPGVVIRVEGKRNYIYGKLASHILGYISWDRRGRVGIEYKWDKFLSGIPGGMQIEVDATGRMVRLISERLPVAGDSVYLNIDKRLQQKAEQLLHDKAGAIVAVNPKDGEVLVMASSPSFDPNKFVDGMDQDTWKKIVNSKNHPLQNRAINGLYPPGSLFKVVVALAGLQEGLISPNTTFVCTGEFPYGNRVFRCWKKSGHGKVNLYRAIKESCDIYFYNLGKMLGAEKIAYYAKMFGLGQKTGIDMGNESKGLVPSPEWKFKRFGVPWQGGETLSFAIGQSFLLVTPLQMAMLYSAIFNGGIIYQPAVTRLIKRADGTVVYRFKPKVRSKLSIKKEYIDEIKKALIAVVNEAHGTGEKARIEGITVAGKTGTAQLAEEKEGTKIKEHAWFVGVAPAQDPKICVVAIIEHGGHGGSAAAPVVRELIKEYFKEHVR